MNAHSILYIISIVILVLSAIFTATVAFLYYRQGQRTRTRLQGISEIHTRVAELADYIRSDDIPQTYRYESMVRLNDSNIEAAVLYADPLLQILQAKVHKGDTCPVHYHPANYEVFIAQKGTLKIEYFRDKRDTQPYLARLLNTGPSYPGHYRIAAVEPGTPHRVCACPSDPEECVFLVIVIPPFEEKGHADV